MKKFILLGLGTLLSTIAANAGTIGPSCGSCFGGTYSLGGYQVSSTATTETWRYTFTLETRGVTATDVSYIASLAAKVSTGLISATTVSGPTGGSWSSPLLNSGLTDAGCNGNGTGFICIAWLGGDKLKTGATAASSYAWVFDVKMDAGTSLIDASIKADFDPAAGRLLSEKISVPEGGLPLELPVLLSGVGGWMFYSRRRQSKATV